MLWTLWLGESYSGYERRWRLGQIMNKPCDSRQQWVMDVDLSRGGVAE